MSDPNSEEASIELEREHRQRIRILTIQYRTGILKKQLAMLLHVGEPELKSLLEGAIPDTKTQSRIADMYKAFGKATLFNARFIPKTLRDGKGLLDFLKEDPLDLDTITSIIGEIYEKTLEERRLHEERLRDLGFEDVSDSQKDLNLKLNT